MQTKLKGKHFITTQEWTTDELETVFELAGSSRSPRRPAGRCGCSPTRRCT